MTDITAAIALTVARWADRNGAHVPSIVFADLLGSLADVIAPEPAERDRFLRGVGERLAVPAGA